MSQICSDEKKLTGDGIEACKDEIPWSSINKKIILINLSLILGNSSQTEVSSSTHCATSIEVSRSHAGHATYAANA